MYEISILSSDHYSKRNLLLKRNGLELSAVAFFDEYTKWQVWPLILLLPCQQSCRVFLKIQMCHFFWICQLQSKQLTKPSPERSDIISLVEKRQPNWMTLPYTLYHSATLQVTPAKRRFFQVKVPIKTFINSSHAIDLTFYVFSPIQKVKYCSCYIKHFKSKMLHF